MTDPIEQAKAIQAEYRRHVESLENDADLTPEARQRRADELHQESAQKMAKLRGEVDDAEHAEVEQLRKAVFGPSFKIYDLDAQRAEKRRAYRAALDRADSLDKPAEAQRLLRRAWDTDDYSLAKAVAYKAFNSGWDGIVDVWLERASKFEQEAFQRLVQSQAASQDTGRKFAQRLAMSAPSRKTFA